MNLRSGGDFAPLFVDPAAAANDAASSVVFVGSAGTGTSKLTATTVAVTDGVEGPGGQ